LFIFIPQKNDLKILIQKFTSGADLISGKVVYLGFLNICT